MAELIDRDALLKKAVTIPGPSGKSVFSVVFTDDILNAESIELTTKNNLGVDCVDKRKVICYTCRFCKMDIRDGKPYCSLREKGGKCYAYDSWESQEDVLDKIRAEIEQLPITDTAVRLVTEILEKYKAESEVEDD